LAGSGYSSVVIGSSLQSTPARSNAALASSNQEHWPAAAAWWIP
jgi:hypothetical protein